MAEYSFITEWKFDAPIESVWDEIYDPGSWPEWWKYVEHTEKILDGDDLGVGSLWKYRWRTVLYYKFTFIVETTFVELPLRLEGVAKGDLEGTGKWFLEEKGNATCVRYEWNVKTNKAWMNLIAPLAKPFFKWNHDTVMKEGYRGLGKRLKLKNL